MHSAVSAAYPDCRKIIASSFQRDMLFSESRLAPKCRTETNESAYIDCIFAQSRVTVFEDLITKCHHDLRRNW